MVTDSANNRICSQKCNFPCTNCTNGICTGCALYYILNQGICLPDTSCSPNCAVCPIGSYYSSGTYNKLTCIKCSSNLCNNCPNNVCKNCISGYYLSSTTCLPCPIQCQSCYDINSCKICSDGYTKQLIFLGKNYIYF